MRRVPIALPLLLALFGCFNPSYPEGLQCDEDGWCPPGQVCNLAHYCVAGSSDAGVDALAFDAAPPDADGLGVLLSISIGDDVTITVGGTHQFTVTAHYELADVAVTEGIIWRSSATGVAGIDFNGLASGVSAGVSEITGRWAGRVDAALLTVNP
jgi:hypothetical protein